MFETLKNIPAKEVKNQFIKLNEDEKKIIYSVSDLLVNFIIERYQKKISGYSSEEQKTKFNRRFFRLFEKIS